ncbi:MAG: ECF-type sigma factor [Pirellulaceae bacterium]|nr:ECF-type sigma factor [Pirellulaceae bacterium]
MNPDPLAANSITQWLYQAREGDDYARQQLWVRYYERLVRLARNRLTAGSRRVSDEEDVVVKAFDAFFRALENGKLPELGDRDGIWRLLVVITDNKANDIYRDQNRLKRGGGQIRGHSAFLDATGDGDRFNQIPDPSPHFAEAFGLACNELLMTLKPELRQVAVRKMEGYTNKEIAKELGCVEESVRRKVILIRSIWVEE